MQIVKGTLGLLILRVLELEPLHGVAVAERIAQRTAGALQVGAGSLFPSLHRLEAEGWIAGKWTESDGGRRIKLYSLTAAGRRRLRDEKRSWRQTVAAINQVLEFS